MDKKLKLTNVSGGEPLEISESQVNSTDNSLESQSNSNTDTINTSF